GAPTTATSGRHWSSSSGSLSERALRKVAGPRNWGPSTWASRLGVRGIRLQFWQRLHFTLTKTGWGGKKHEAVTNRSGHGGHDTCGVRWLIRRPGSVELRTGQGGQHRGGSSVIGANP